MANLQESTINGISVGRGPGNYITNQIFGCYALGSNTSGQYQVAVGYRASCSSTTAACNVIIGNFAGSNITTISQNVFIGHYSGSNAGGYANVFAGTLAGYSSGGIKNVAIGYKAGCCINSNIVAIGTRAGRYIGDDSVALGFNAAESGTGNNSVIVGGFAGQLNTWGGNTTLVGFYTGRFLGSAIDNTHVSWYGYQHGGYGQNGDNSIGRYQNNVCNCIWVAWTNVSDTRDKANMQPLANLGINFVRKLRPVEYVWDHRQKYVEKCGYEFGVKDGTLKGDKINYGFIAQEVEFAANAEGETFDAITYNNFQDKYTLSYLELIAPLVKSIQQINDDLDLVEAELNN
jgi:hypothetical protein